MQFEYYLPLSYKRENNIKQIMLDFRITKISPLLWVHSLLLLIKYMHSVSSNGSQMNESIIDTMDQVEENTWVLSSQV